MLGWSQAAKAGERGNEESRPVYEVPNGKEWMGLYPLQVEIVAFGSVRSTCHMCDVVWNFRVFGTTTFGETESIATVRTLTMYTSIYSTRSESLTKMNGIVLNTTLPPRFASWQLYRKRGRQRLNYRNAISLAD